MCAAPVASKTPLVLICGDDEFAVKHHAKELFQKWSAELGGMDHEIIDAAVSNSSEALKALARLREALQTLPFFGSGKAVWFQNCTFLGDERAASAQTVTEMLGDLTQELKDFKWGTVRLLVSAGKVDKRKAFYKAIDKLGEVVSFAGWSIDDRDWVGQAEAAARRSLRERSKDIDDEALAELVTRVGPNSRQLESEIEKLSLYAGDKPEIALSDVEQITTRNKNARAFAVGDALGDRDLPRLLRRLDEELWEMKLDPQKSEIGLLYGLISKVRAMILLKEMMREGWIKSGTSYPAFKAQIEKIPPEKLPSDKRFNPQSINPFVLYKALPQAGRFTSEELVRAMEILLECNQKLVSSAIDESLVLQQALVQIVGAPGESRVKRTAPR